MDIKSRRERNKANYKKHVERPVIGYYGDRALTISSEVQYYDSGNVIYKYSINPIEFNEFKDLMFYIIDRASTFVYSKQGKTEDDGN